jgi:hypothetical protein
MSENSGPAGPGRGFSRDSSITETARETRRLTSRQPQDDETKRENKRLKRVTVVAPTVNPVVDPPPTTFSPPPGTVSGPPEVGVTPEPILKDPPSSTVVEVLDPNVYTVYRAEIKRLTLKLVNRAKNLLLAYNFSSIDRITDYQIETDSSARNSNIITTPQVPQSPSTSTLTAQDTAVSLINAISNQISDNVPMATKLGLFGSDINGTFTAGRLGISNGIANYDLRFRVDNVSPEIKNIIVRCYEIG